MAINDFFLGKIPSHFLVFMEFSIMGKRERANLKGPNHEDLLKSAIKYVHEQKGSNPDFRLFAVFPNSPDIEIPEEYWFNTA